MSAVQDRVPFPQQPLAPPTRGRLKDFWFRCLALAPGLLLAGVVAGAAFGARQLPWLSGASPIILAIVLGMALRSAIGASAQAQPGLAFAAKQLMRLAIVLLGLQLTVAQVAGIGVGGVAVIAATLAATFLFTIWAGRLLGVDARLTQLIAAGTSICGASAIAATNAVTRADDEDVAYAIACITGFGTVAMLAYPWLAAPLGLDAHAYGLWAGASIHEVAQVVAAAFDNGPQSGEIGVVSKLTRVMMLAPVVAALAFAASRRAGTAFAAKAPTPWFVLGFVALVCLNSVAPLTAEAKSLAGSVTTILLTVSLAAMGLGAEVTKLWAKGPRPFLLGLASFAFVAVFGLALVKIAA